MLIFSGSLFSNMPCTQKTVSCFIYLFINVYTIIQEQLHKKVHKVSKITPRSNEQSFWAWGNFAHLLSIAVLKRSQASRWHYTQYTHPWVLPRWPLRTAEGSASSWNHGKTCCSWKAHCRRRQTCCGCWSVLPRTGQTKNKTKSDHPSSNCQYVSLRWLEITEPLQISSQ